MEQSWRRAKAAFAFAVAPPTLWLVLFFLAPMAIIWAYSFGHNVGLTEIDITGTFKNYWRALEPLYLGIFAKSLWVAALTTLLAASLVSCTRPLPGPKPPEPGAAAPAEVTVSVVGTSDVHEHGKTLVESVLGRLGVAVIDLTSGAVVRTLKAGSDPETFVLSPDGATLAGPRHRAVVHVAGVPDRGVVQRVRVRCRRIHRRHVSLPCRVVVGLALPSFKAPRSLVRRPPGAVRCARRRATLVDPPPPGAGAGR